MQLSRDNIEEIRGRFFEFFDGVVRSVRIDSVEGKDRTIRTCEISLDAKDRDSVRGWSRVNLRISGVSEFRFQHGRTIYEVLSDGIQVVWRENSIYVLLDANPDDNQQLRELSKNIAYVIGESCELEAVGLPA
jgi:hypothetical protein